MAHSGYLGGDVPMRKRQAMRDHYLSALPVIDGTWRNQCRCGATRYAKWRGRFYCVNCARWVRALKVEE